MGYLHTIYKLYLDKAILRYKISRDIEDIKKNQTELLEIRSTVSEVSSTLYKINGEREKIMMKKTLANLNT